MKPNRPYVISSTRNHITIGWNPCESLILKQIERSRQDVEESEEKQTEEQEENRRWYLLERKDYVLGWNKVYMGFETQKRIGPMKPGDYYEFRLKVKNNRLESDWSDTLFASTKDDVIALVELHRIVENGPVTSLRKILSQRPPCIDVPNKYGQTALRLAITKKKLSFVGIMLKNGADVNNLEIGSGRTPLMIAASSGNVEAVQLLLEKGSSWETKDGNGCSAFNYAIDNSHLELVQMAIESGIDIRAKDRFGWSPLMRGVVLKSSFEVLSLLLENGSDVNEFDYRKQTVLMQAVLSGRPEIVELLLSNGADAKEKNIYGHSAYEMAKNSCEEAMVKMAHILCTEEEGAITNKRKVNT